MKKLENPYRNPDLEQSIDNDNKSKEKGKKRVTDFLKETGKNAAKLAEHAKNAVVNAIDYYGDEKFDLSDFSTVASRMEEKREQVRLAKEFNELKPIFEDTIHAPEFTLPKLIRVAEIDKKHAEGEVCQNSIGFKSEYEGLQIITIYPSYLNLFGLKFYPDINSEIYYVDPCGRDYYIALDKYFEYLRHKRVNELNEIAQALGAKHFKVSYIETEKDNSENKVKVTAGVKEKLKGEGGRETESKKFKKIEIGGEMNYLGHEPTEPVLRYLKGNPNIEFLIKSRMAKNSAIHQKVRVNLISSSGIKVKDAAKIDGAIKALHFNANGSFQEGALSEASTELEYEIDY